MEIEDIKKLSNSEILRLLQMKKDELESNFNYLEKHFNNLLNQSNNDISKIKKIISNLNIDNELVYNLEIELINRNYNTILVFENKKYTAIELLKLKQKLLTARKIDDIILTSEIDKLETNENKEDILKLSLTSFKNSQENKVKVMKIHELLSNNNNLTVGE